VDALEVDNAYLSQEIAGHQRGHFLKCLLTHQVEIIACSHTGDFGRRAPPVKCWKNQGFGFMSNLPLNHCEVAHVCPCNRLSMGIRLVM